MRARGNSVNKPADFVRIRPRACYCGPWTQCIQYHPIQGLPSGGNQTYFPAFSHRGDNCWYIISSIVSQSSRGTRAIRPYYRVNIIILLFTLDSSDWNGQRCNISAPSRRLSACLCYCWRWRYFSKCGSLCFDILCFSLLFFFQGVTEASNKVVHPQFS